MIPRSLISRPLLPRLLSTRGGFLFAVAVLAGAAAGGAWHFGAFPSNGPSVSMSAAPVLVDNRLLLMSYEASDNSGIKNVALRVTPHNAMPGANNAPVEIELPAPAAKKISRIDSHDLSAHPWAGQKVTLQIAVTNGAGKKGMTEPLTLTLPERRFFHPIARVLIEERNKLMQNPDDNNLREEAANIMASIAHDPTNYRGDPVVLMALRSGAVRLVLGRDRSASIFVGDILWQAAARIDDQNKVTIKRTMGDIRQKSTREF